MDVDTLKQSIQVLTEYSRLPGIFQMPISVNQVLDIRRKMPDLKELEKDYPLLVNKYSFADKALIYTDVNGNPWLNPIALGQMITIFDLIISEEHEPGCWQCIHPMIKKVSFDLYLHEHYSNAAEDAFIEINARAKKLRPEESECDGRDLMNKLFGSNSIVELGDLSTETGKNIHQGFHFLFAGSMAALRNPKAHSNDEVLDAREAMRRIMLASMLMYKLDEIDRA